MKDKKKFKVLIVDDEVFISEQLKIILNDLNYEVTDIAFNSKTAIESLKTNPPDIAILDIKMHGENQGFEIAQFIRENMNIPFVFLTSFADTATVTEASELTPDGYLLKPFNEADIFSNLNVVLTRHAKKNAYFTIQAKHSVHKVKANELLWIQSSDKYIEIQTKNKRYLKRDGIESFLNDVDLPRVMRVHRSYAVNIENIDRVKGTTIFIEDHKIPVSKSYLDTFKIAYYAL